MSEPVYISNDEALEALRAAAWSEQPEPEAATCGHPGCTDHPGEGRKMIHVQSGFGCDISLEDAEDYVRNAQRCAWVDNWLGHELGVICADGDRVLRQVAVHREILDLYETAKTDPDREHDPHVNGYIGGLNAAVTRLASAYAERDDESGRSA